MKVFRWLVKAENDLQSVPVDMSKCGDAHDVEQVKEPRRQEVLDSGEDVPRLLPVTKDEEALLHLLQTSEVVERIRELRSIPITADWAVAQDHPSLSLKV